MVSNKKSEIRLGRMELAIMNVVWSRGRATVQEVKDSFAYDKPVAYSTVLTMMRKLETKGYLKHEVADRTYVYLPTLSRADVRKGLLGDLLDRLFEGSPTLLVNNLIEQKHFNRKELDKIRKLIDERSTQND
jgi:BlaI family transcriptional regulator, penicillinase repressor